MRTLTSQAARDYAASLGCNIMSQKTNIQPAADVGKLLTMMETEVRALMTKMETEVRALIAPA